MKSLSHVRIFATPWTVAYQTPPSMGFSRQEYWSGLPFLSPGVLSNPRIEPVSPALQAATLTSEPPGKPSRIIYWSPQPLLFMYYCCCLVAKSYPTLWTHGPPGSSIHGLSQARIGCHFLLQGIFPTRESDLHLLHGQVGSLPLSTLASPLYMISGEITRLAQY